MNKLHALIEAEKKRPNTILALQSFAGLRNWQSYFSNALQTLRAVGNRHYEFLFDANDLESLVTALSKPTPPTFNFQQLADDLREIREALNNAGAESEYFNFNVRGLEAAIAICNQYLD